MTADHAPPISDEGLAEIVRLAEAATPGPWITDEIAAYRGFEVYEPPEMRGVFGGGDGRHVVRFDDDYGTDQWADARFIAAARAAVPAMAARIEAEQIESDEFDAMHAAALKYEAENAGLRAQVRELADHYHELNGAKRVVAVIDVRDRLDALLAQPDTEGPSGLG